MRKNILPCLLIWVVLAGSAAIIIGIFFSAGRAMGANSLAYGAKRYNAVRRGRAVIDADVVSAHSVNGGSPPGIAAGSGSTAFGAYASRLGQVNETQGSAWGVFAANEGYED